MSQAPDLSQFDKDEIRETLDKVRHPVSIAVFGSENYFNTGAIIRTAHLFLVQEIILVDIPKFYERAAMGTHKWENITHMTLCDFVRKHSVFSSSDNRIIVAMERRPDLDSKNLIHFKYPENPILCFGNEKTGLPDEIIDLARSHMPIGGDIVSIPQFGLQNDMNLANAASVAVYDWIFKKYSPTHE